MKTLTMKQVQEELEKFEAQMKEKVKKELSEESAELEIQNEFDKQAGQETLEILKESGVNLDNLKKKNEEAKKKIDKWSKSLKMVDEKSQKEFITYSNTKTMLRSGPYLGSPDVLTPFGTRRHILTPPASACFRDDPYDTCHYCDKNIGLMRVKTHAEGVCDPFSRWRAHSSFCGMAWPFIVSRGGFMKVNIQFDVNGGYAQRVRDTGAVSAHAYERLWLRVDIKRNSDEFPRINFQALDAGNQIIYNRPINEEHWLQSSDFGVSSGDLIIIGVSARATVGAKSCRAASAIDLFIRIPQIIIDTWPDLVIRQ